MAFTESHFERLMSSNASGEKGFWFDERQILFLTNVNRLPSAL